MNLYFRMLLVFIKIWLGQKKRWNEDSLLSFRVYPFDCDINLHLTSSRYIGIADLGRMHLLGQMGIFSSILKRGFFPFANGIEITYIRPIKPFQKFKLRSCITNWDEKYWYAEHTFEAGSQIYAIAFVRGVFIKDGNIVSMDNITKLTGETPTSPAAPETVKQWQILLKVKKEEYSSDGAHSKT
jgi:acyl-CoA thioesterase FadM